MPLTGDKLAVLTGAAVAIGCALIHFLEWLDHHTNL
jgi:hypothetical protein